MERPVPAILLADGEPGICYCLSRAAGRRGVVTHVTADGASALRLHRQHADQIQAAFIDLRLPGQGGLTVTRELHRGWPGLPVCLMTTSDQPVLVEGHAPGGMSYLIKPFDLDAFLRELDALLAPSGWGDARARERGPAR